jgi:hypothetical protein
MISNEHNKTPLSHGHHHSFLYCGQSALAVLLFLEGRVRVGERGNFLERHIYLLLLVNSPGAKVPKSFFYL